MRSTDSNKTTISLLARLFASDATYREIEVAPFKISLKANNQEKNIEALQAVKCTLEEGWIWSKLYVQRLDGENQTIGGLTKQAARDMKTQIDEHISKTQRLISRLSSEVDELIDLKQWISKFRSGSMWLANRHLEWARSRLSELDSLLGHPTTIYTASGHLTTYAQLNALATDLPGFRLSCNAKFKSREIALFEAFFNRLMTPPTMEQREATICDEDSVLVVASAGSGKTTLLLSKVQYLLEKNLAEPRDILILAFNRSAKENLQQGLYGRTGYDFETHTFHSFGQKVLAESTGRKPSLAPFADSETLLSKHIYKLTSQVLGDPELNKQTRRYFLEYLRPHKSAFDFQNQGDYLEYLRNSRPLTFQGEEVRSMEELTIANTLFAYGINYEYEPRYMHDTASIDYRQYRPDFYLPDYDVYIEHFALDKSGNAPAHFKNYKEGVIWKRETHAVNQTKLIETYSYQAKEGNLQHALLSALKKYEVKLNPQEPSTFFDLIKEKGYASEFSETLKTFLRLFKGKGATIDSLRNRVEENSFEAKRFSAFLAIFERVFKLYEEDLKRLQCIDFDDMINQARAAIQSRHYNTQFKYLLVDEFQDISLGRALFLKALKDNLGISQLFAVGDDWQAINRFAGGDVTVMTSFEDHFGFTSSFTLTQTFRFNDKVNAVASQFILRNPYQLRKTVKPVRTERSNQVIVVNPREKSAPALESILREISLEEKIDQPEVLILARYRYVYEALSEVELKLKFPELELAFSTVHSAKGRQADYVVILGLVAGSPGVIGAGFPSEAVDDPLFSNVLASLDLFENSEERRLLYVALTRSKNKVYLISDPVRPSSFTNELVSGEYEIERRGFEQSWDRKCPSCITARLVARSGPRGLFLGCSNYRANYKGEYGTCIFTTDFCKSCGTGFFHKSAGQYRCDNPMCNQVAAVCPECNEGYLVKRSGRYGEFWGCSNYSLKDCGYTKKVKDRGRSRTLGTH